MALAPFLIVLVGGDDRWCWEGPAEVDALGRPEERISG